MHKLVVRTSSQDEKLKMVGIDMFPSMIAAVKEAIEGTPLTFTGFIRDAVQKELDRKEKLAQRRVSREDAA